MLLYDIRVAVALISSVLEWIQMLVHWLFEHMQTHPSLDVVHKVCGVWKKILPQRKIPLLIETDPTTTIIPDIFYHVHILNISFYCNSPV